MDSRYKNGVHQGAAKNLQEAVDRARRQAFLAGHPGANGWEFAGWCKISDLPVYRLEADPAIMLRMSETRRWWIVFLPNGNQKHFADTPEEFTPDVVEHYAVSERSETGEEN